MGGGDTCFGSYHDATPVVSLAAFRGGGQNKPNRPSRTPGARRSREARENRGAEALLREGGREPHIEMQGPRSRVHQAHEGEQGGHKPELGFTHLHSVGRRETE